MTGASAARMIDAHGHSDIHGYDFDRTVANMDEYGISKTWLLTWEAPSDECDPAYTCKMGGAVFAGWSGPVPFERCLRYKERAPERFVLGYMPDPRRPGAIDMLAAAVDIYGVRVCGELKCRMMYDNPDALRLFRFCGKRGLPVIVHIDYEFASDSAHPRPNYWYGGGIEAFERAVAACPETVFLGHGPGFWAHISADDRFDREAYPGGRVEKGGKVVEMLRRFPNLYCDLSAFSGLNALQRDGKFTAEFIDEFSGRLLFARDCFDNRLQTFLDSLSLPRAVADAIFFGNADRLVSRA